MNQPGRVLIVDDDPAIRRVLELALASEAFEVRQAGDGREGLAILDSWRPDLILLDLMMPVMDGWAFRDRQRETASLADIPVIVLSASCNLRGEQTAAIQPAAALPKPFDLDRLLETVGQVISRN
jgi:CheY-like chemotaxis protein